MKYIFTFFLILLFFLVGCNNNNTLNNKKVDSKIIDVRTIEEYETSHVKNAINIDYYSENFTTNLDNLNKNTPYIVYCRTGHRSGESIKIMKKLGFTNLTNGGGLNDMGKKGYIIVE